VRRPGRAARRRLPATGPFRRARAPRDREVTFRRRSYEPFLTESHRAVPGELPSIRRARDPPARGCAGRRRRASRASSTRARRGGDPGPRLPAEHGGGGGDLFTVDGLDRGAARRGSSGVVAEAGIGRDRAAAHLSLGYRGAEAPLRAARAPRGPAHRPRSRHRAGAGSDVAGVRLPPARDARQAGTASRPRRPSSRPVPAPTWSRRWRVPPTTRTRAHLFVSSGGCRGRHRAHAQEDRLARLRHRRALYDDVPCPRATGSDRRGAASAP